MQRDALRFFEQGRWPLERDGTCSQCFRGDTKNIHDGDGKEMHASRAMISTYTTRDLGFLKSSFPSAFVFTGLSATAWMSLRSAGNGCVAALRIEYGWYGTKLVLGVPIEGDRMGGFSNLKLENAYLDRIGERLGAKLNTP